MAIIVEGSLLPIAALKGARADPDVVWRPSVEGEGDARMQASHRDGLLFARLVLPVFALLWIVLAALLLRRP